MSHSELFIDAAKSGNLDKVKIILNDGKVDVNYQKDGESKTALMEACKYGRLDVVYYLLFEYLPNGSDTSPVDVLLLSTHEMTALSFAIRGRYLSIAKLLLDFDCATPSRQCDLVNVPTRYGNTALIEAVFQKDVEMVKLLLNYNPDILAQDTDCFTALDHAKRQNCIEIIELLEPLVESIGSGPSKPISELSMIECLKFGHVEIVRNNYDDKETDEEKRAFIKEAENGKTLLMVAGILHQNELLNLFLDVVNEADVLVMDNRGFNLLWHLVHWNNLEGLELLLKKFKKLPIAAFCNRKEDNCHTLLERLILDDAKTELFETLLKYKPDLIFYTVDRKGNLLNSKNLSDKELVQNDTVFPLEYAVRELRQNIDSIAMIIDSFKIENSTFQEKHPLYVRKLRQTAIEHGKVKILRALNRKVVQSTSQNALYIPQLLDAKNLEYYEHKLQTSKGFEALQLHRCILMYEIMSFNQFHSPNFGWILMTYGEMILNSSSATSNNNQADDCAIFSVAYSVLGDFFKTYETLESQRLFGEGNKFLEKSEDKSKLLSAAKVLYHVMNDETDGESGVDFTETLAYDKKKETEDYYVMRSEFVAWIKLQISLNMTSFDRVHKLEIQAGGRQHVNMINFYDNIKEKGANMLSTKEQAALKSSLTKLKASLDTLFVKIRSKTAEKDEFVKNLALGIDGAIRIAEVLKMDVVKGAMDISKTATESIPIVATVFSFAKLFVDWWKEKRDQNFCKQLAETLQKDNANEIITKGVVAYVSVQFAGAMRIGVLHADNPTSPFYAPNAIEHLIPIICCYIVESLQKHSGNDSLGQIVASTIDYRLSLFQGEKLVEFIEYDKSWVGKVRHKLRKSFRKFTRFRTKVVEVEILEK